MELQINSVSITYNPDIELLGRQIDSLAKQVQQIIIVDNGSTNLTELENLIKNKQGDIANITFIKLEKNMGLGFAQNVGIKLAIEKNASDVLLLDQDSVLKEYFVNNLVEARGDLLKQNIKVGAIGPVYYSEHNNQSYPITKYWGPFIQRIQPDQKPEKASFLIASGCLMSTNALNDIGLMNEELFIDCIDIEWSFRAVAKGYELYAAPQAVMLHTIGEKRMNVAGRSIAVHSPLRRYYLFRNSVYMVRNKNIPVGYKVREIVFNTLRLIVYFSVSRDRIKYLKYSFNGFKDGVKGVTGECLHRF